MNIEDWPLGKVMQLPDCAFGARWPLGVQTNLENGGPAYDIVELSLPERIVVWEVWVLVKKTAPAIVEVAFALSDSLPASAAEFNAAQLLFPGVISLYGVRGSLTGAIGCYTHIKNLRVPFHAAGRRLVAQFYKREAATARVESAVVVSSIPREVPDCLLTDYGRSR